MKIDQFTPNYELPSYSKEERWLVEPFFTNLDKPIYASLIFSPEVIGALCSRSSRAAGDLRRIFLDEYIMPFVNAQRSPKDTDASFADKVHHGEELRAFIQFLHDHPVQELFSNPRARSFYVKWLAQYGDDSIAQMAGMHVAYSSLSVLAIKHFEDQRIGLAPIEKSTRYVDYGSKINGQYQYYTDPTLAKLGLEQQYRAAMDGLFDTYVSLRPAIEQWLSAKFPEEKPKVIETKAFDTLRGLLPISTLSQVALFGNGQAFEYAVSRSLQHPLGEVRWAGEETYKELSAIAPSFLRRVKSEDPAGAEVATNYQQYMAGRGQRVAPFVKKYLDAEAPFERGPRVKLIEYDPDGEAKVLAGILYSAPNNHHPWDVVFTTVKSLSTTQKAAILDAYLEGRQQRWQKVGRAFENAYVRFELTLNWGAWKDLQRHRMLTQQRQHFTVQYGYDVPAELIEAKLDGKFRAAMDAVAKVYHAIAKHDLALAQYVVTHAHHIQFMQWTNLRSCFWEMELRTIPEGHPDYRWIEQEKFRLLEKVYPLIASRMHVNMDQYDFARRGQEERIAAKLRKLETAV